MHTQTPESDDCFAVRQAARHISQLYERHLSEAGVTPTQFSILRALKYDENLAMVELAQALVMDRTTLVRALRPLLHGSLIRSAPREQGMRRHQLTLTVAGHAKLEEATVYWRAAQREFEYRFGFQQAAFLRSELFRLTGNVSGY